MSQPDAIDGFRFAREGGKLRGSLDLRELPRLAETPCKTSGIDYFLRGGKNIAGKASIQVLASGRLELVCQRCLDRLEFVLELDVELELCGDMKFITEAEDEVDRVLAETEMSVARLVEDEVILILPQVPRHEDCETSELNARARKASPFGVLAKLKKA
ncbi:MAG: YceD family protein [Burkholderiales bacterium]